MNEENQNNRGETKQEILSWINDYPYHTIKWGLSPTFEDCFIDKETDFLKEAMHCFIRKRVRIYTRWNAACKKE
jgi:hypothetical protein